MEEKKKKKKNERPGRLINVYLEIVPTGPRKQLTGFDDDTEEA